MIHNLSRLTFPSAPPPTTTTTTCGTRCKASASSESQLTSSKAKTQLTDFSQIPKILCARFRCVTSFTSSDIWDFYFDISEWHILPARAWTPVLMLPLTNPCAKREVLSLTKPKGKIYKTKSLGHYITIIIMIIIIIVTVIVIMFVTKTENMLINTNIRAII